MAKREFIKLMPLTDYRQHDKAYQEAVRDSGVVDGWTLACDQWGDSIVEKFAAKDLTFVEEGKIKLYDVLGGVQYLDREPVRFTERDMSKTLVLKDTKTKSYWLLWHDDIDVYGHY